MAQNVVTRNAGLNTFKNYYQIPEGALMEAVNVVIDRDNIVEPRRGNKQYGNTFGLSTERASQLFVYKGTILRHVGATLQYDSDLKGNFQSLVGSYAQVKQGLRLKSIEANSNFYFTSADGIQKISISNRLQFATATITPAGGVKALDLTALPDYSQAGFLSPDSQTAYRVVWGIKDANENLILGAPSAASVAQNVSAQSCITKLNFAIPSDVTSSHFYQVYRTGVFDNAVGVGEEFYLVFEDFPTALELVAGEVDTTDITPEDFRARGALLYTNPVSGEGIEQSNEKPPFAQDITLFKGYTFYGNTSTVQRLSLSLLAVDDLISNVSAFTVSDGITSSTYTFQGAFETYTVDYSDGALVPSDFYNPGMTGRYFTLSAANDERQYTVYYKRTDETDPLIPGYIPIEVDISTAVTISDIVDATLLAIDNATTDFNISKSVAPLSLIIENSNNGYVDIVVTTDVPNLTITSDDAGLGEDAANKKVFLPKVPTGSENGPSVAQQVELAARSIIRVINKEDTLISAFYLSGFNDVPGQMLFENRSIVGAPFFITANSTLTGQEFDPTLPTTGNSVISNNEALANRVYYSKFQQPEAVPLVNYFDVGPRDKQIERVIGLRDSLLVFKEDGIYRVAGDVAPFTVTPMDFSAIILAPDSAVILNNQVYCLSSQGVIAVTDTGVSVVSRSIENLILNVTRENQDFKFNTVGVSYESDRAYMLFTVSKTTDTFATQCFRFNVFTNSWTRWNVGKTCGIVNPEDNKLYLGPTDKNFIEVERKSLTDADFADREFELQVIQDEVNENKITLSSLTNIELGDVLVQTQYLTIAQFNRLLKRLDRDISIPSDNYFDTLHAVPGDNLRNKLTSLALKLDSDGLEFTDYLDRIDSKSGSIISVSAADPALVTTTANHGLLSGRYVILSGISGTLINGEYVISGAPQNTYNTIDTFTIDLNNPIAQTGGTFTTDVENSQDIQACYNIIVQRLNADSQVFWTDYDQVTGKEEFYGTVIQVIPSEAAAVIRLPQPYLFGEIILFKAIQTEVIWAPQYFGDPSIYKQVSEATMMFETTNFTTVFVGFSSDLSPAFEEIEFAGQGSEDWGEFQWSQQNWGGIGAPIPLRTYIPRQKQRCRFMNIRFRHRIAFEKFSIYGHSLTFRAYSTRSYR